MKITQILALNYIRAKFRVLSLISVRKTAEKAFKLFCTPGNVKPLKHTPSAFTFAEQLHDTFNGRGIKGYRWNKGKPVKILILHGFSSSAAKFHSYVLPLVEKGYEVLAFDAPAHGESEGKTINAVEYEMMVQKLVRNYGPFNGFIAHSFGGLALSLAMEKIPHDASTKMVLIAPATETTTAVDHAFTMLGLKNKRVRKAFDRIILKISGKPTEWFSVNRAMEKIKAAVLWVHDEDDDTTPLSDTLRTREKNYPNVRFVITKGLGHRQVYRDAAVRKEVLEFL